MALFRSSREKRLWLYTFTVLFAIIISLFFGRPLLGIFGNEYIQATIFILSVVLTGVTILVYSIQSKPGKTELTIWIGIIAVYLLLFLRLGIPERSHLIEYSVLAIFIHRALIERINQGSQIIKPAIIALIITILIGALDECIQLFLPNRIFDMVDIIFNGLAGLMAIGSIVAVRWVRKNINLEKNA